MLKTKTTSQKVSQAAKQAGFMLMAAAATVGMLDMPDHLNSRIAIPNQPAFAWANNNLESEEQGNNIRREREEVAPHYISFSEVQRTAARSGRV